MEIKVSDYGSHLFDIMMKGNSGLDHWESIRAKAEPLVRQLIDLNYEMSNGGYQIYGYEVDGKRKLSEWERARQAQFSKFVEVGTLAKGSHCWTEDMDIGFSNPCEIIDIRPNGQVLAEDDGRLLHLNSEDKVMPAPQDWEEAESWDRAYWLAIADKLGI